MRYSVTIFLIIFFTLLINFLFYFNYNKIKNSYKKQFLLFSINFFLNLLILSFFLNFKKIILILIILIILFLIILLKKKKNIYYFYFTITHFNALLFAKENGFLNYKIIFLDVFFFCFILYKIWNLKLINPKKELIRLNREKKKEKKFFFSFLLDNKIFNWHLQNEFPFNTVIIPIIFFFLSISRFLMSQGLIINKWLENFNFDFLAGDLLLVVCFILNILIIYNVFFSLVIIYNCNPGIKNKLLLTCVNCAGGVAAMGVSFSVFHFSQTNLIMGVPLNYGWCKSYQIKTCGFTWNNQGQAMNILRFYHHFPNKKIPVLINGYTDWDKLTLCVQGAERDLINDVYPKSILVKNGGLMLGNPTIYPESKGKINPNQEAAIKSLINET